MADTLTNTNVGGGQLQTLSGIFAGTGQSTVFQPNVVLPQTAGVINPVWVCVRGTFGSVQLEYSPDGGANWYPITAAGVQLYIWTSAAAEPFEPNVPGCQLRLNCTASTGTIYYDVRQIA